MEFENIKFKRLRKNMVLIGKETHSFFRVVEVDKKMEIFTIEPLSEKEKIKQEQYKDFLGLYFVLLGSKPTVMEELVYKYKRCPGTQKEAVWKQIKKYAHIKNGDENEWKERLERQESCEAPVEDLKPCILTYP